MNFFFGFRVQEKKERVLPFIMFDIFSVDEMYSIIFPVAWLKSVFEKHGYLSSAQLNSIIHHLIIMTVKHNGILLGGLSCDFSSWLIWIIISMNSYELLLFFMKEPENSSFMFHCHPIEHVLKIHILFLSYQKDSFELKLNHWLFLV